MKKRPPVERYKPSPAQKAQDALRAQAAAQIGAKVVTGLLEELQGRDGEFIVAAIRAVIRGLALVVARRFTVPRAVGLLSGAATLICPAFEATAPADVRTEADAVFSPGAS